MASGLNQAPRIGAALAALAWVVSALPLSSETAPRAKRERTEPPPHVADPASVRGDDDALDEARDLEAHAARLRERHAARRSRFEQEPVDPSWSHDYAAAVRDTIEAHGGPALAVDAVDCRLTGCRIALAVVDRAALLAGAHALRELDAAHHVQVRPQGIEVFVERPGITGSSPDAGIEPE